MKTVCALILVAVSIVAVTCIPSKASSSRIRRQSGWVWDDEALPTRPPTTAGPPLTPVPDRIRACMKACPATSQFNPVCGSNGVTYDNEGKLKCAIKCGAGDVQVAFLGSCNI